MTKAIAENGAVAAPVTRRALLGTCAAAGVLAIPVAVIHPDAELLAACTRMRDAQAALDGLVSPIADDELDRLDAQIITAMGEIAALPALTQDGVRAKAHAAHTALMSQVCTGNGTDWREEATPMETLALMALREMAGAVA